MAGPTPQQWRIELLGVMGQRPSPQKNKPATSLFIHLLSCLLWLSCLCWREDKRCGIWKIKGEWSRNEFELPGPKTYNQLLRPPFKEWKEQPVNHSISFHFIPPIQKKITFFFIAFISWNLLNEMEGIKKYYNSKLIEQLADNIKTKFIWFLWRKQVVRLVWVEEMKWIIDEFMNQLWMKWNPLKQRRPPIQFLFFFPFSLFENERDEEKKRIDGQLAAEEQAAQLICLLVGYRRRKPQATSQKRKRASCTNPINKSQLNNSSFLGWAWKAKEK